jgi:hypothetical protein
MNRSTKRKSRMPDIPNLSELTEQVEHSFFEAMRRPPRDGDRPFYWSYCYSDAEFNTLMIATMLRASIPQRLIYIYDKTGFMVSKEGHKRLTKEEEKKSDWQDCNTTRSINKVKRTFTSYQTMTRWGQRKMTPQKCPLCLSPHIQNCKSDLSFTKIYDRRRSVGFS